jgi:hypothetical protein
MLSLNPIKGRKTDERKGGKNAVKNDGKYI